MTIDPRPMDWVRHREVVRAAVVLALLSGVCAGFALGYAVEHWRHRTQAIEIYNTHTAPTVTR